MSLCNDQLRRPTGWLAESPEVAKSLNVAIFSDTINMMNVKLCMMAVLTELCLFIPFSERGGGIHLFHFRSTSCREFGLLFSKEEQLQVMLATQPLMQLLQNLNILPVDIFSDPSAHTMPVACPPPLFFFFEG